MLVEELARALSKYPDSVRILDRNHEVLMANEAAQRAIPDGLGHLCGPHPGRDPSCPACQADAVFELGAGRRWHLATDRQDGSGARDFFEITLSPVLNDSGKVEAVLEVLRDQAATLNLEHYLIDEAERKEGELGELRESQAERLYQDRLVALERLVAGVAHEVHTPLGAVASSVDLLQRAVDGLETNDERRKKVLVRATRIVAEGANRIEQVIKMLRLFYRVDESERKEVDVHDGLDSTIRLLDYRMGDRIDVLRDYGEIPCIICRPDSVNQIFMNVLLNAVQAIPERGTIWVRTRATDDGISVEVRDDGEGMTPEDLEQIFDLGFTTKKRGVGSGLGLAICKKVADQNGIRIAATSQSGVGTTFTVHLPGNRSEVTP